MRRILLISDSGMENTGMKNLISKALAGSTKILLYSHFQKAEHYLFDYIAAGVNGVLDIGSDLTEHQRALDALMRGDAFVDVSTRANMLSISKINSGSVLLTAIT